jgi:mannose-6-phosphate isomerase
VTLLPARLDPVFVPRIWGSRTLAPLFPDKNQLTEPVVGKASIGEIPIGEIWMTGNGCRFASNAPDGLAGKALGDVWSSLPIEWTGTAAQGKSFPLLVKFLFPREKLSVQVHPGDEYARQCEASAGGVGKTEMWYVIAGDAGAGVLINLKPGVTPSSFRRAIAEGTAEGSLEFLSIKTGDAVFVPAGTVHTIGPGLVLCEIQQNSDITYRVFDYERRDTKGELRPLHLEKALAVMNFGEQTGGKIDPVQIPRGAVTETFYVACRHFAIEKWEFSEDISAITSGDHFDLLIILEGEGAFERDGQSLPYSTAHVWLIPAALGAYHLAPTTRTTLLRTYVPPNAADLAHRLTRCGVPESTLSRLIHP